MGRIKAQRKSCLQWQENLLWLSTELYFNKNMAGNTYELELESESYPENQLRWYEYEYE